MLTANAKQDIAINSKLDKNCTMSEAKIAMAGNIVLPTPTGNQQVTLDHIRDSRNFLKHKCT